MDKDTERKARAMHPSGSSIPKDAVDNIAKNLSQSMSDAFNSPELESAFGQIFDKVFDSLLKAFSASAQRVQGTVSGQAAGGGTGNVAGGTAMAAHAPAAVPPVPNSATIAASQSLYAQAGAISPPPQTSAQQLYTLAGSAGPGVSSIAPPAAIPATQRGNPTLWPTTPVQGGTMSMWGAPSVSAGSVPQAAAQLPLFTGNVPSGSTAGPLIQSVQPSLSAQGYTSPQTTISNLQGQQLSTLVPATSGPGYIRTGGGGGIYGPGASSTGGGGSPRFQRLVSRSIVRGGQAITGGLINRLSGSLGPSQQTYIDSTNLQVALGSGAATGQSAQDFYGRMTDDSAMSQYGYTSQDVLGATQAYAPWMMGQNQNRTMNQVNNMAAFGSGTGLGLQQTAAYMGGLAQAGWISPANARGQQLYGGQSFGQVAQMTAAGMAQSQGVNRQDWEQGLYSLAQQQTQMTLSTDAPTQRSLTDWYTRFNASNAPGLRGTAGAQVMGQINAATAGALNSTPYVQQQVYAALGGNFTPAEVSYMTTSGAFKPQAMLGKKSVFQKELEYGNSMFGDDKMQEAYQMAPVWGVTTAQALTMVQDKHLGSGNLDNTMKGINRLVGNYHLGKNFLNTSKGMSALADLADISSANGNKAQLTKVYNTMQEEGVSSLPGGKKFGSMSGSQMEKTLVNALKGGIKTDADKTRASMDALTNMLNQIYQKFPHELNTFVGALGGTGPIIAGAISTVVGSMLGHLLTGFLKKFLTGGGGGGGGNWISGGANALANFGKNIFKGGRNVVKLGANLLKSGWNLGGDVLGGAADAAAAPVASFAAPVAWTLAGVDAWNTGETYLHKDQISQFMSYMKKHHSLAAQNKGSGWSFTQGSGPLGTGEPQLQYKTSLGEFDVGISEMGHIRVDKDGSLEVYDTGKHRWTKIPMLAQKPPKAGPSPKPTSTTSTTTTTSPSDAGSVTGQSQGGMAQFVIDQLVVQIPENAIAKIAKGIITMEGKAEMHGVTHTVRHPSKTTAKPRKSGHH